MSQDESKPVLPPEPMPEPARRALLRQAACVASAWAASGVPPAFAAADPTPQAHGRTLLVDAFGSPLLASRLAMGEPYVFNYPFDSTPVFLIALRERAESVALATEAQQRYEAPAGVGPHRAIVAFSAICAHKLMYPTPQISFIGFRKGSGGEPSQVIHCCGDDSRYDPQHGARVLAGPAPQPLAAVLLEWEPKSDRLHAAGTLGGEMFKAFFEKYALKLEMDHGAKARTRVGGSSVARPASEFSRQWQTCRP